MTYGGDTLAEVVVRDVSRAKTLDRLGLDYCCGGDATLDHACAEAGLDVSDVIAQLESAPTAAAHDDCGAMTPVQLVGHLLDVHHRYLHSELPALERMARKVLDVHGGRHPELLDVRTVVGALHDDLEPHLLKEERVLFPAILELAAGPAHFGFGSIANPIGMLGGEHDRTGELLARLRTLTGDYAVPDDGCATYRSFYERLAELEYDTHLHVLEENHLLFPRAVALESART